MSKEPAIAVVIGAFQRETFLLSAVRSVLGQTLARDRYEVVVTKDFRRDDIDEFLAREQILARLDADPRIGTWLLGAVRSTTAPLLAFLDDDDEFEPERLAHVLDVFHDHPEVGFYRNRVSVIDERGDPTPSQRWRHLEKDPYFDRTGPILVPPDSKGALLDLATRKGRISFNSSTIIIRRELLDGRFGEAFARTQLPDLAFFLFGVLGPYGLYLDDRRLTRFRYYRENVTHRVEWLKHASEAYRDLASLARAFERADFAAWLGHEAEHYDRLHRSGTIVEKVGAGASRREVARLACDYLRFLMGHPAERGLAPDVWAAEAYASVYLLAPRVARRVRDRRLAGRP